MKNSQLPARVGQTNKANKRKEEKAAAVIATRAARDTHDVEMCRRTVGRLCTKYGEVDASESEVPDWCGPLEFVKPVSTRNREIFVTTDEGDKEMGTGDPTNKGCPARTKSTRPTVGAQPRFCRSW
jgi:hypothetical protein